MALIAWCFGCAMIIAVAFWLISKDAEKRKKQRDFEKEINLPPDPWNEEREEKKREEYENLDPNDIVDQFNDMLRERRGEDSQRDG